MFNLKPATLAIALWAASVRAGTVQWSGIFNATTTVADFDKWSFSNQIEPWQYYIHGTGTTETYLGVSSEFKNPADTSSAQGLRTTIDGTAFWNGQTMERTEVIPQTKANLGTGHLYYHFSLSTSATNAPNPNYEHQIAFFESHFTELKYGTLSGASGADNTLRWMVGGQTKWSVDLAASTWYNFAYDIDFDAKTVGLWASTGSEALTQVVENVAASTSTNSADWHIGVLRLPNGGTDAAAEDYFWSGIYVEEAPVTTAVAGPNAGAGGEAPAPASSTVAATSTAPATTEVTSSTEAPAPETTEVTSTEAPVPETTVVSTTEAPTSEPTTTEAVSTEAPAPETTEISTTEAPAPETTEVSSTEAPVPETTEVSTTEEPSTAAPEPTSTDATPTEDPSTAVPEPTSTEAAPTEATTSAAEPTETAAPSESSTEAPTPEPTETTTEAPAPEPTETAAPSETTSEAPLPTEPTTSASESTVEATTAAPEPTTAAPEPTTSSAAAPAPTTTGVKDANVCWREYNKCLDASQPFPDFSGCGTTRDSCMDGARYMRLARSGTLGRAMRR